MRHAELHVSIEEWGDKPVVRAEGEIDLGTVDALRRAASEVVRGKPESVIFDLTRVTYIDSSGLGILVATRKNLGGRRDAVVVITSQPAVLQSLRITGLDRIFSVLPDAVTMQAGPAT